MLCVHNIMDFKASDEKPHIGFNLVSRKMWKINFL